MHLEIEKIKYPDYSIFPDVNEADSEGLLAQGGDLSPLMLLEAYSKGIFPWFSEDSPILWWSPDPRMILLPKDLIVSHSLKQRINKKDYELKFDTCFKDVISQCAKIKRKGEQGTWITDEMQEAYINLHKSGFAHSVEIFKNKILIGGLYGISLGKSFFGESMFHLETDASKLALYHLVERLKEWKFDLIDVQVSTDHLKSLGAKNISRDKFISLLNKSLEKESYIGNWGIEL